MGTNPQLINGLEVVFHPSVLVRSDERLFPESNHRSARIKKKLIKRFNGEFKLKPGCYQLRDHPNKIFIHSSLEQEFRRQSDVRQRSDNG